MDPYLEDLIYQIGKLPGIGPKSASRIAFYLLSANKNYVDGFVKSINNVKNNLRFCDICANVTSNSICSICSNPNRSDSVVCVVEEPKDILPIEHAKQYNGKYHVLGGIIDPINNIGPDMLRIRELIDRISEGNIKEVIMALNPSVQGETTVTYISNFLRNYNVKITRLAFGLPVGGDIEYADDVTLARAFQGRSVI